MPEGSRATAGKSLRPEFMTEENLAKVRGLNEIAKARGQSLAQMAIAWVLRLISEPKVALAVLVGGRGDRLSEADGVGNGAENGDDTAMFSSSSTASLRTVSSTSLGWIARWLRAATADSPPAAAAAAVVAAAPLPPPCNGDVLPVAEAAARGESRTIRLTRLTAMTASTVARKVCRRRRISACQVVDLCD